MSDDDNKEEQQVDITEPLPPRHKYVISGDELDKIRLKLNELKKYFSSHSSPEIPPQIDELMTLFQNIPDQNIFDRPKLRNLFNSKPLNNHAQNIVSETKGEEKNEDNVVVDDCIDGITAKTLNNHAQNMVNGAKPEEQKENNVALDDLTYDLMEVHNWYAPITLLEFNAKHQTIACDVADILSKEPDYKTQCNCFILSNDSPQQINDAIKQIQNTLNLTDKQMIGVKRRINEYYEWRKLYNGGRIKEFTNKVAIFTIIHSAINTTDVDAQPNALNTWKCCHYLLRFMKEYINNGGNLEKYLFELGRLNTPEKKISASVCKKYELNDKYFQAMKAVMKTWIRNNMSFVSQRIDESFKNVFVSNEMIAKYNFFMNANEDNCEKFLKHLWVKSKKLSSYKSYKTNAGFKNLKLIVFWTSKFNDENERMYVAAMKHDTFENSLTIIDLMTCDTDKMEIVRYGIKMGELPTLNTNGNTIEISDVNEEMNLWVEPSTDNSSLNSSAKTFAYAKKVRHKLVKLLPIINEEEQERVEEESNEEMTVDNGNNNEVLNDLIKKEKPNSDIKIDDDNDNDDKKECKEYEIKIMKNVSCDLLPMWKSIGKKWTQSILDDKVICESFPNKERFFDYVKYKMYSQQINKYYKAFKCNNKQYIIFNSELRESKSKYIMYIIFVIENGKCIMEAFMNEIEINKTYCIKKDNLPNKMFKVINPINPFQHSLVYNIPIVSYLKLPQIKTSAKKKLKKMSKKNKVQTVFEINLTKLCNLINIALNNKSEVLFIVTIDKPKQKCFIDAALPIQFDDNNCGFIIYRNYKPIAIGIDCNDIKIKAKLFNPKCNVYKKYDKIQNNITQLHIINDQKLVKSRAISQRNKCNRKMSYQGIIVKFHRQNGRISCNRFKEALFCLRSAFEPSDHSKIRKGAEVQFEVECGSIVPRVAKAAVIETESHGIQMGYGCYNNNNVMYRGNGYNYY